MFGSLWLFASIGLGLGLGRSAPWYAGLALGIAVYAASFQIRAGLERLGIRHAPRKG